MSNEFKKLYKTALASMNYFFLQIIFSQSMDYNNECDSIKNDNNHLYKMVKCELQVFLDVLVKEKDLSKEVKILFKEELISGEYLEGKTIEEIENELTFGVNKIFEYNYSELVDFYMELVEDIKK